MLWVSYSRPMPSRSKNGYQPGFPMTVPYAPCPMKVPAVASRSSQCSTSVQSSRLSSPLYPAGAHLDAMPVSVAIIVVSFPGCCPIRLASC
jgi:hypothetical protein